MLEPILLGALILGLLLGCWWLYQTRTLKVSPGFDFPTRIVSADGWDFHYMDAGRGPVILLLHGIGANLLCWRRLWPLLTPHFRVIALDLPGFGRSSKHRAKYGLEEQSQRLELFLNKLGIREAHLVGNSMGGNIALWFAAHHPERTTSVTCIAPATEPRLIPFPLHVLSLMAGPLSFALSPAAIGWAHRRTVSRKELVDRLRINETWQTYGRKNEAVRSFFMATESVRDRRLSSVLPTIEDEVLVLWGKEDKLVPQSVIDQLQSTLKKCTVKVHLTGGHHLQEDEPDWVSDQLQTFFSPKKI